MNYGRAIRTIRASRGLSQTELSSRSGFSSAYISKIEDGQRVPTIASLEKISDSLNVPFELLSLLATRPGDVRKLSPETSSQLANDLLHVLIENKG